MRKTKILIICSQEIIYERNDGGKKCSFRNYELFRLIQTLLKEKKFDDIEAVSGNRERRHELYKQYGI